TRFDCDWSSDVYSSDLTGCRLVTIRGRLVSLLSGESRSTVLVETVTSLQPVAVYRDMWQTPKGRETARRLVLRDCPYIEIGRAQIGRASCRERVGRSVR